MRYLLIEDFKFGLDSRRFMLNSPAGTLTTFTNGHITPGGEIEKRRAFTKSYLPANCFGLEVTPNATTGDLEFTVFGSVAEGSLTAPSNVATTHRARTSNVATLTFASHSFAVGDTVNITGFTGGNTAFNATGATITAVTATTISYANTAADVATTADTLGRAVLDSTLPDGVTYQRLQHPDGVSAMTAVIHSTVYNGAAFVIADFGAGGIISFYDGEVVDDLSPGKLATILADADALADYVSDQIDALDDFTAIVSGGTVTVDGQDGLSFNVATSNESTCTEPLDTTPPNVSGLAVTACTIVFSTSESGPGPGTHTAVISYSTSIPTYTAGFGLYSADLLVEDGDTIDLKALADAVPGTMLGGATKGLFIDISCGGAAGTNIVGTATIHVEYAGGATKDVVLNYDVDYGLSQEITTVFDADPAEVTPTITAQLITDASSGEFGTIPQAQFQVVAVEAAGTGKVTSITLGGTEVLGTAATDLSGANYATPELMADAIATQINTYCTANNVEITATGVGDLVVMRATDPANYTDWTGDATVVTVDGGVAIGNCAILMQRASLVSTPTWDAITVDGVDILGATVVWNTDMPTSVADVATQINTFSADYFAFGIGSTLYISKLVTASGNTAQQVQITSTYLLYSAVGSTDAVQGGTFPGTIVLERADIPLRLQNNRLYALINNSGVYTGNWITCLVSGGLPPYRYKWEVSSGDTQWKDTTGVVLGTIVPYHPTSPSTNVVSPIKTAAQTFASVKFGLRCQVTDSQSRVGYSPEVSIHYP